MRPSFLHAQSFNYSVDGSFPKLEVRVSQTAWSRLMKALLWSAVWGALAYRFFPWSGVRSAAISVLSIMLCFGGLLIANYSVQWNTLWVTQDVLRLRMIRLFTRTTRAFPLPIIRDFGFGHYSHNGSVLKLDVEGSWLVLARDVREDDVGELLVKIKQSGYSFPEGKESAYNPPPTPKFWMLD
jgi:hypothetical protein